MNVYCKIHNIELNRRKNYWYGKQSTPRIKYYCPKCKGGKYER